MPTAPKPGVVPLRPLGLTEILDGAFAYIRRSPGVVLGISAIIAVVSSLVQLLLIIGPLVSASDELDALSVDPTVTFGDLFAPLGEILGATLIAALFGLVLQTIGTGILTVVMARAVLGQDLTAREAWERSRALLLPLLGLVTLYTLGWLAGGLLFLIPGIYLYVVWSLAAPALMLERRGVIDAFGRSFRLVKGSFWRVLGILLLAAIIAFAVAQIVAIPFALVGGAVDGFTQEPGAALPLTSLLLSSLGSIIGLAITLPFTAGVTALIYVDQRMRREAFDLELAAATRNPSA
jgi:hypothetical protein